MNQQVEQLHPWARGRARPPLQDFVPRRRPKAAPAKPAIDWNEPGEVEFVNAEILARLAAEVEARRRRDMRALFRLLGMAAGAVVALILVVEAWQHLGNSEPGEERLAAAGDAAAALALAKYSSPEQPMEVEAVRTTLAGKPGGGRADYELRVTLRLRDSLYAPADSNGAQPYQQLQRAVAEARDETLRLRLYLDNPALAESPRLPLLLAMTHRAGERLVVRYPLEATRPGWSWRVRVVPEPVAESPLPKGQVLAAYGETPVLVFNSAEGRATMRPLMTEARRFVLAVDAHLARSRGAAAAGTH